MGGKVIWVERLGVFEIFYLAARSLFSLIVVRYDGHNVSGSGKIALRLFKGFRVMRQLFTFQSVARKKET